MSRHRAPVRPRYGRMALVGGAFVTTLVAVLGGVGVLPVDGSDTEPASASVQRPVAAALSDDTASAASGAGETSGITGVAEDSEDPSLPADSGSGRRVVFSEAAQRVWLVGPGDRVVDTYLVSGSLTDNLQPGSYEVFSRSRNAYGIEDSGTMRWFVRFTRGPSGAAIGFHTIPVDEGARVQTVAQLGTPQSHGCIRQRDADARELWAFAPLGTRVVVV